MMVKRLPPSPAQLSFVQYRTRPRPVFAFIDKTWLSEKRYEESGRLKQQWRNTYNRVQNMNNLAFDPYYASALIAMAQNARSSISDMQIQVKPCSCHSFMCGRAL
jgi:hypothetical protein